MGSKETNPDRRETAISSQPGGSFTVKNQEESLTGANGMKPLTRDELWKIERGRQGGREKRRDLIVSLLPFAGYAVSVLEYLLVPDKYENDHFERYLILLTIPAAIYLIRLAAGIRESSRGNPRLFAKVSHWAPFMTAIYLLLACLDMATLKTGALMYPFIPWVNDVINVMVSDRAQLAVCTLYSVRLLLLGYFSGSLLGLVTGVACGYSEKIRYWIQPIVRVLGPIPTATWIPVIMLIAKSLMGGAVFIVGLGAWFAVTIATTNGIANVDPAYYEAARTLGANNRQLVFRVAIPGAMPGILQGMTQAMSSACVSLVIAEMMGVKAGLGWYITWAKSWAAYNKMFAAIIMICIVFNVVTKAVDRVRDYVLRWQK